jgi:hypothetical protein
MISECVDRLQLIPMVSQILPPQDGNVPQVFERLEVFRFEANSGKRLAIERNSLIAMFYHHPQLPELQAVKFLPRAPIIK